MVKCRKPLAHNPQFEGKLNCKACEREMKDMLICAECDGEMTLSAEHGKPMMLLTGDIDTGNERIAVCKVCGHRVVHKD